VSIKIENESLLSHIHTPDDICRIVYVNQKPLWTTLAKIKNRKKLWWKMWFP